MRRIQLYLEHDIDHALTAAAAKSGRSRSAIMRDAVSAWLGSRDVDDVDAMDQLIGSIDIGDTEDIDAVIYGT
jgi:predicted transcriptional regulator